MLAILSLLSAGENRSLFIMPEIYDGVNVSGFCFCCAFTQSVCFLIIRACYNMGKKGNEAMISVIGTYKKPGVAAPGFLFWAGCGYKYLSSHLQI